MHIQVFRKDTHELYTTPLLQQTAYWSEVKSRLGFVPLAFEMLVREKDMHPGIRSSARLADDVLVLYMKIADDQAVCYIPYGPLLSPDEHLQGEFIESLSEELRRMLPQDTILIRYDLPWLVGEEMDAASRQIMMNWGTVNHNIRLSGSGMLPSSTCFVDLSGSEEEILDSMKSKTRYNVTTLSPKGRELPETYSQELFLLLRRRAS